MVEINNSVQVFQFALGIHVPAQSIHDMARPTQVRHRNYLQLVVAISVWYLIDYSVYITMHSHPHLHMLTNYIQVAQGEQSSMNERNEHDLSDSFRVSSVLFNSGLVR